MLRPFVAIAFAVVLALPAAAQQRADRPADRSGGYALPPAALDSLYVTLEDVRRHSREIFDRLSGGGEGPIPRKTFLAARLPERVVAADKRRELLERLFGLLDADGDGRLTRHEWNDRIDSDMRFADRNDDGRITLDELANAKRNLGLGDLLGRLF